MARSRRIRFGALQRHQVHGHQSRHALVGSSQKAQSQGMSTRQYRGKTSLGASCLLLSALVLQFIGVIGEAGLTETGCTIWMGREATKPVRGEHCGAKHLLLAVLSPRRLPGKSRSSGGESSLFHGELCPLSIRGQTGKGLAAPLLRLPFRGLRGVRPAGSQDTDSAILDETTD